MSSSKNITLLSSPLQGYTGFCFRNAYNKYFWGIDSFYAPYIRATHKSEIKQSNKTDILPKNNPDIKLIPQIITRDADNFLKVADYVQELGYSELNWNLGCPYPMVAKRGMGSGLINEPETISAILHKVQEESNIEVSVKMRLGYESKNEILNVLPILEKFSLKSITIHPRTGKQLYRGSVDLDFFQLCIDNIGHTIYYNGDIRNLNDFNALAERFPSIKHWLIGRGLLSDPFLPGMIKNDDSGYPENRMEIFSLFHDTLFETYRQALSGSSHLLMKMKQYWEYFANSFPDSRKTFKKVKKAKSLEAYDKAVYEIFKHGKSELDV